MTQKSRHKKAVNGRIQKNWYVIGTDENIIIRSIEFPPEYHQAGISILNYFGTIG